MRKLLILILTLTISMMAWAQDDSKLSATTQMFLNEMKSGSDFKPIRLSRKTLQRASIPAKDDIVIPRLYAAPQIIDNKSYISCYLRVEDSNNTSDVEALGVIIESRFKNGLTIALIPVDKIEELAEMATVKRINVSTMKRAYTDKGRSYTNTDDVLEYSSDAQADGLTQAYDGSGVLLGIIDNGVDFQHIAFKDASGNYRMKRAYCYNGSSGQEYSSFSGLTTDDSDEDHGTHTCSTAGGSSVIVNGSTVTVTDDHSSATYGGMAPGADLYLAGIYNLSSTYLDNAVNAIVNYADNNNMPVVVSNSWGSSWGPRDGSGETAEIYDQLFDDSHPNRVALFASSNDAGSGASEGGGFYVGGTASSSSPLGTIMRSYASDDPGYKYYSLLAAAWCRTSTTVKCKVHVLDSSTGDLLASSSEITPSANGTSVSGLSSYYSGDLVAYYDSQNSKRGLQLYSSNGLTATSGSNSNSPYTLAVEFYPSSGSAYIDVWAGDYYGWFTNHLTTSGHTWVAGTDDMSVSDEATITNAISVGAYVSKTSWKAYNGSTYSAGGNDLGDIADFSSYATTAKSPTGLRYPWITAPGAQIVSAVNHYSTDYTTGSYNAYRVNTNTTYPYAAMQGTSMATPTAAGIVALWLQVAKENNVDLTTSDIKNIMAQTAIKDSYVNSGSNSTHFGNGKIDALAGIKYILDNNALTKLGDVTLNDASSVGTTSFTASWTDNITADHTYTLEVNKKGAVSTTPILTESFSKCTKQNTSTDISSSLNTYTDNSGWTGTKVYQEVGGVKLGSSSVAGVLTTPSLDLTTSSGKVTVKFNAMQYGTGNEKTLSIKSGNSTAQSQTLTTTASDYVAVIDCSTATGQTISFTASKRAYIYNVEVYLGDVSASLSSSSAPRRAVSETGDADSRTITGITAKNYTVQNLTQGETYEFKVKAVPDDATEYAESNWSSTKEVTLASGPATPELVVDPETLSLSTTPGGTTTATFDVLGADLTGNVTLTLTDANNVFSISPSTISVADAEEGATVTVTYAPSAAGTHSATVTVASEDAESVTVTLNGTASLAKSDPVMSEPDMTKVTTTSFTADWTDATDASAVSSYTLYVNKKQTTPSTTTVDDVIDKAFTGVTGTSYTEWTGKTGTSGAVYAGQSAASASTASSTYVQLRSNNSNSGIVTTGSGGKISKVAVTWDSSNTEGRTINVYGTNTAYSAATDLYNTSNQGTLIGTIVYGTSTELSISDEYAYVGIRSASGAIYLNDITFTWTQTAASSAPRRASETGDADSRTITGITAKTYTVENLTSGATYEYNVKALYTDNTESALSNTEEVILTAGAATPELVVDPASLTMSATAGQSTTATFEVLGADLTGNVTLTLTDENNVFSLSSNSITAADAEEGATVTVTYAPSAAGSHTATVTVASEDAESVTVTLNGTATAAAATPELVVDSETVALSATAGSTATETFTVLGADLTEGVTLTLTDANNVFSISPSTISVADAEEGAEITVTYAPSAAGSHTATVTVASDGAESVTVTLNGTATAAPQPSTSETFRLATSLSDLNGVTDVIIVNQDNAVALSRTQNTNNRGQASVTLSSDKSTATVPASNETIAVLTLGTTTKDNATVYTFFDPNYSTEGGYLYAASSSKNYLRTETTLSDNSKASVAIANTGVATITFQGTNTNNWLRYNSSNSLFSCYGSTSSMQDVYIYYRETEPSTDPTLSVVPSSIDFGNVYTGSTNTETFTVSGANLTEGVTLALSGDNAALFSIDPSTISAADAEEGATVTVTYSPTAVGTHSATVTVSSDGVTDATVALTGTAALEKAVPVMQTADSQYVTSTSFKAEWTDATPAANVSSYTLYVNKQDDEPDQPTLTAILTETFDGSDVENDGTADVSSSIDSFADNEGWTGSYVYKASSGVKLGSGNYAGTLTTPALDLSGSNAKVTVKFNAKYFGTDESSVVISSGENESATQALTTTASDYVVVVDCTAATGQTITFSGTAKKKRFYIYNVEVFSGDVASALASSVPRRVIATDGDADIGGLTISGITDKEYTVSGLTPGATYDFKVKAVYTDETESAWSNEESVTLPALVTHTLAEMVADNTLETGDTYAITDGNLLAVAVSADGKSLFCKDNNGYATKVTAATGQIDYMATYGEDVNLREGGDYDQSNWVVLTTTGEFDSDLVGNYLNGVSGTISNLANPSIAVSAAPTTGEAATTAYSNEMNVFIPTNFGGETSVVSGEYDFFFMTPKPMEVALVTWAMWDGEKFVAVPKTDYTRDNGSRSTMNPFSLSGTINVNTERFLAEEPTLTANTVYKFTALITNGNAAATAPALNGPAKAGSAGGFDIYALSGMESIGTVGGTVTGIEGLMQAGKEVRSTAIYNTMGSELPTLQRGVNIVVIEYTDGTKTVAKVLR